MIHSFVNSIVACFFVYYYNEERQRYARFLDSEMKHEHFIQPSEYFAK